MWKLVHWKQLVHDEFYKWLYLLYSDPSSQCEDLWLTGFSYYFHVYSPYIFLYVTLAGLNLFWASGRWFEFIAYA